MAKAKINSEVCVKCGACIGACPNSAISQANPGELPAIDKEKCTGCGTCLSVCPVSALKLEE